MFSATAKRTTRVKHYGIEYDFIISNNGGIIRDETSKMIFQANIDSQTLRAISIEPLVRESFHFAFSAKDTTYLCHESDGSWIMREAKEWDFPITKITESEILNLVGVQQFALGFNKAKAATNCAALLNEKFPEKIRTYPNAKSVDITPEGISKQQGLKTLLNSMGWLNCEHSQSL